MFVLFEDAAAVGDGGGDAVDELGIEEMQAYVEKMSKWSRDVVQCTQAPLFWLALETMRIATQPFSHCLAFLQRPVTATDSENNLK